MQPRSISAFAKMLREEREDEVGLRVDVLGGGMEVGGGGQHDVGHEGLGVAVVEGEPGALDLDHDFVAF